MLIAFLIMLREGIEAALIVGIVAGFLKQGGYRHMMPKVWLGVVLAAAMCLFAGWFIYKKTGEIPQKQQEFVVGVIGLVAVAMLTYMVLWMQKAAKSIKQHLQQSVSDALNRGNGHARRHGERVLPAGGVQPKPHGGHAAGCSARAGRFGCGGLADLSGRGAHQPGAFFPLDGRFPDFCGRRPHFRRVPRTA